MVRQGAALPDCFALPARPAPVAQPWRASTWWCHKTRCPKACPVPPSTAPLPAAAAPLYQLAGSTGALAVMTVISVAIGFAFKHVPEVLTTSAPVGEYLGAALLVYFGVRTLKV